MAGPEEAVSVGHGQAVSDPRPVAGMEDVRLHDLRHIGPSVLLMQGSPGDIVRKITGHRSRELERPQRLSPLFRAQTVDLIAQVLLGDTPTDTPAPDDEEDDANLFSRLAGWTGLDARAKARPRGTDTPPNRAS